MILGLMFLVGALIVYFDFIQPVYGEAQELKAKQLSLEDFLNNQKVAIGKVQDLINAYQGQGEVRQAVSLALPEREDVVGALAQIYGLVQSSGLSLQSVSASEAGSGNLRSSPGQLAQGTSFIKPIGISTFQLKLSGSYEDLKVFLARLETNMRVFDLRSLVIQPTITQTGKSLQISYAYDLTVATYNQSQ